MYAEDSKAAEWFHYLGAFDSDRRCRYLDGTRHLSFY